MWASAPTQTCKPKQKPNCELGSRFGKEETSAEDKKHRSAMIRSVEVVSDASPTARSFLSQEKRLGRKECFLLRNRHHVSTQERDGRIGPPLLPIYESLPKEPALVGDGGVVQPEFTTCACGRRTGRCGHRPLHLPGRFCKSQTANQQFDVGAGPYNKFEGQYKKIQPRKLGLYLFLFIGVPCPFYSSRSRSMGRRRPAYIRARTSTCRRPRSWRNRGGTWRA